MRNALISRLERLEQRAADGVGILTEAENTWFAIADSRSREFSSEYEAIAFLEQLTETIILDDI